MTDLLLGLYHRLPVAARSVAATLRGYYLRRWRYGADSERLVAQALEREHWSAEQWAAWRESHLAAVLERAATQVPYYRDAWQARRRGGSLSGGEQQMLTVARTLMGNPRILLLDEPSEGLAPVIVQALGQQITALRHEGLTIVLSEQNLKFAARLADRAYIIEKGEIRWEGAMGRLLEDEGVRRAYLTV